MARQGDKRLERMEKPKSFDQAHRFSPSPDHTPEYTMAEILQMNVRDVLELFTNFERLDKLKRNFKLRCHLLGDKCTHLASGRSLRECKSVMENHLETHRANYSKKFARSSKFYSQMKFKRYTDMSVTKTRETLDAANSLPGRNAEPKPTTSQSCGPKHTLLTPTQLLKTSNTSGAKSVLLRDNIFSILSRELLPTVVVDKIDLSPKKSPREEIHDAYDCHCENTGDEICRSKQALLSALCLERIRLKPDDCLAPSATVNSTHCTPKLLRTRSQRKKAILERIYQKHQAAAAPCRLRKRLNSLSQPAAVTKKKTSLKQVNQKSFQQRSPRNRLLIRLRQSNHNALKRDSSFLDIKGYNLRRAKELLKKTSVPAKTAVKVKKLPPKLPPPPTPPRKEEVYNPVGEVIRMPLESMLELMEEEERLAQMQPPEVEPPSPVETVPPPRKLPPHQNIFSKSSRSQCPNILRRHQAKQSDSSSESAPENMPPRKHKRPTVMVRVNGKLVPIKAEPDSDDEYSISAEFFSKNPGESSSVEPTRKRQKMTVSSLLFKRRKDMAQQDYDKSSDSDDSTHDEDNMDSDDAGREEEDINVTSVSDDNDVDNGKFRLPPSPSKIRSATVAKTADTVKAGHSKGTGKKPRKIVPAKIQQTLEDIKREIEEMPVPTLTKAEIALVALFNDHTYHLKEVDCIRKMDAILSKVRVDDVEDEDRMLISRLTDEEMKIREKALILLRHIKQKDKKKEMLHMGGEMVRDGEDLACKICNKRFTAPNSLYYHYRSHAGVKPYKCDICFKTFTRLHSLHYHTMIHTNSTRFKCKYCNRGFRHPSHFKEHLNKHTGEEPYQCPLCPRRFKTSNTHRRHMASKHSMQSTRRVARRVLPYGLRTGRYMQPRSPPPDEKRSLMSHSPPLPDSPPAPILPIKPFAFTQPQPVKLVLFPKNGLFRYSQL